MSEQRVFFALWPEPAVRDRIQAALAQLPRIRGRPVGRANWHITLSFLGAIDEQGLAAATAAAEAVDAARFELVLDQFGHFPRAGVVFLGAGAVPEAGAALVAALDQRLEQAGFEPRWRPWRPHLTLWRKNRRRPRLTGPAEPVRWPVHEFVLVRSELTPGGAEYTVTRRFPLGGL